MIANADRPSGDNQPSRGVHDAVRPARGFVMAKHATPQPVVVPLGRTVMVASVVTTPAAVYVERLRTPSEVPMGRHAR